jgi:hypothetical protein
MAGVHMLFELGEDGLRLVPLLNMANHCWVKV